MGELVKLQEAIEKQRSRLDNMIGEGINFDDYYEENVRLDRLIERYIELEKRLGAEVKI